jgi:hypothetical protein
MRRAKMTRTLPHFRRIDSAHFKMMICRACDDKTCRLRMGVASECQALVTTRKSKQFDAIDSQFGFRDVCAAMTWLAGKWCPPEYISHLVFDDK